MCNSCVGCKYLYEEGEGYSNYTWEDTRVECALRNNPNLPAYRPYGWFDKTPMIPENDKWVKTNNARCERYIPGPYVMLDIDHENGPVDFTNDEEIIGLICAQTKRGPAGGWSK
jgi:hypothetical protein